MDGRTRLRLDGPPSRTPHGVRAIHFDLMDRRLARRNLRTGLITAVIGLLMFALTFVAALLYVA